MYAEIFFVGLGACLIVLKKIAVTKKLLQWLCASAPIYPSLFAHLQMVVTYLTENSIPLTLQFLQQINVKNVHPVFSTGIRTHDLQYMSRLP